MIRDLPVAASACLCGCALWALGAGRAAWGVPGALGVVPTRTVCTDRYCSVVTVHSVATRSVAVLVYSLLVEAAAVELNKRPSPGAQAAPFRCSTQPAGRARSLAPLSARRSVSLCGEAWLTPSTPPTCTSFPPLLPLPVAPVAVPLA